MPDMGPEKGIAPPPAEPPGFRVVTAAELPEALRRPPPLYLIVLDPPSPESMMREAFMAGLRGLVFITLHSSFDAADDVATGVWFDAERPGDHPLHLAAILGGGMPESLKTLIREREGD